MQKNSITTTKPGTSKVIPKRKVEGAILAPLSEKSELATAVGVPDQQNSLGVYEILPATRRRRWPAFVGFVACVVLPTLLASYYYIAVATPQYISEIRFGVRSADAVRNDATSIFQGMASASQIGLDSYMVVQFIKSREMVDLMRKQFDFNKMFAADHIDLLSRLQPDAQVEDVVKYWNKHVEPFFDLTTGSVTVGIKSFSPADSKALGDEIIARSEKLVNETSARARRDALATAEGEVARAETRMKSSLTKIQAFRDKNGRIDPSKEADGGLKGVQTLQEELTRTKAQLSVQKTYMNVSSPAVQATERRIKALADQIEELKGTLTSTDGLAGETSATGNSLSQDMGVFDELAVEQKFAEENYRAALETLEKARLQADRQISYLSVFVRPSIAESSTYPNAPQSILIAFVASFGVLALGNYCHKEHSRSLNFSLQFSCGCSYHVTLGKK